MKVIVTVCLALVLALLCADALARQPTAAQTAVEPVADTADAESLTPEQSHKHKDKDGAAPKQHHGKKKPQGQVATGTATGAGSSGNGTGANGTGGAGPQSPAGGPQAIKPPSFIQIEQDGKEKVLSADDTESFDELNPQTIHQKGQPQAGQAVQAGKGGKKGKKSQQRSGTAGGAGAGAGTTGTGTGTAAGNPPGAPPGPGAPPAGASTNFLQVTDAVSSADELPNNWF